MICLSKNLSDEYINSFAAGSKLPVQNYDEPIPDGPILIRSIAKKELIKDRMQSGKPFYYMDSGYVGNYKDDNNRMGHKWYHRIVKNSMQHSTIIERPSDRWEAGGWKYSKRKGTGRYILLVVPSGKALSFWDINPNSWVEKTIAEIKSNTDRPIIVREKTARAERLKNDIFKDLDRAWATVTFNSIAAVESVMYGIPAFTLAPTAADPVADKDLSLLENPTIQHVDKLAAWCHHLAYGQFHINEFKNGKAYKILMENE